MLSKYKIGDKVLIVKQISDPATGKTSSLVEKYKGNIATIIDIDEKSIYPIMVEFPNEITIPLHLEEIISASITKTKLWRLLNAE